jgi:fermentation-respiration switch protein FrsA (DUF1100 family)
MLNLLLALAGTYVLICIGARVLHRYFIYLPDRTRYAPQALGLVGVQEVTLTAPDGVKLIAWYAPAKADRVTFLYFTGNDGCAGTRVEKIKRIQASGYGILMVNYRRYGGSGGWPSEANNVADAVLAYDWLRKRGVRADEIIAYGESLGTGVATQLALQRALKALVLEAPFTSIVEVGRQVWGFLPLQQIMVDQYRTIDYIGQVRAPLYVVHGARDSLIPVHHARQVYAAANGPKTLVVLPGGDHNNLYEHGAFERVRDLLEDFALAHRPGKASRPVVEVPLVAAE